MSYKCINMWLAKPHRSSALKSLNTVSKGYIHWKCRINLWNQKYRFILIYWKLAESWQFKQLQNTAPQAPIISSNFWMASWLCNIVLSENKNNFAWIPWSPKLKTPSLHLETQSSCLKDRAKTVNLLLSGSQHAKSCPIAQG